MSTSHVKFVVPTILVFMAAVTVAALYPLIFTGPPFNRESAAKHARTLIDAAGGSEKLQEEASQIFKKFSTEEQMFFCAADLKDYPKISSLGSVNYLMPDYPNPRYIDIRVGKHQKGYILRIYDKAKDGSDPNDRGGSSYIYIQLLVKFVCGRLLRSFQDRFVLCGFRGWRSFLAYRPAVVAVMALPSEGESSSGWRLRG